MTYLNSLQRGCSFGLSGLYSGASAIVRGGQNAASSTLRAGAFMVIPRNGYIGAGAAASGFYAKAASYAYLPGIISDICVVATQKYVGNQMLGTIIGKAVVVPAVVPVATPWAAGAVAVTAGIAATTFGNSISSYLNSREKTATATNREIAQTEIEDDWVMVDDSQPDDTQSVDDGSWVMLGED